MNPVKKNPLGRGLESLIPKASQAQQPSAHDKEERLIDIDITDIYPNQSQPRKDFDSSALESLALSIKEKGLMQPIVVTRREGGGFSIVAGERRWRACGLAGIKIVPAVVVPVRSDDETFELALIENTQRDDLKPLELAIAYKSLMEKCSYRQEDVAKIAGKSRSAVANTLRLLELNPAVMDALTQKLITEGHARVFLSLTDEKANELLNMVLNNNLSVRQTEALAKKLQKDGAVRNDKPAEDADLDALLREMESYLGSKVKMKTNTKTKGGVIEIRYGSPEDLDRIVNKLRGE